MYKGAYILLSKMSFMQVVANSAFEVQFPGDELPFTLVPGKGNVGALIGAWTSDEDEEFFSDMYPRMRPGLAVAECNGKNTVILDFDTITDLINDAKQSRHFLFVKRQSKWELVRSQLHYIAKNMSDQQGGTDDTAKELSRRAHLALLRYIRKGEEKYYKRQLTKITNIDFQNDAGVCALHMAIGKNNLGLLEMLIQRNADIFIQNKNGTNGLMIAAASNYESVLRALLDYEPAKSGMLVHETDKENLTALHYAARSGHVNIIRILLQNDANAHVKSVRGMTPLHFAALGGHSDTVTLLLHLGFSNYDLTEGGKNAEYFAEGAGGKVQRVLKKQEQGEPVHMIFDGQSDEWVGSEGGRVYLGSWESISPWWLKKLKIDFLVTAFNENEVSLEGETLRFLLDSIEDSDTARFISRDPLALSSKKKKAPLRRLQDEEGERSDSSNSESSDSSSDISSLSSSSDNDRMGAIEDSNVVLSKTVYTFDAHGNSTVVYASEDEKFPPYPKVCLEHFKLTMDNKIDSQEKWKRLLQYLPSAARLLDKRLKANKRVLIACHDGESTSPTICAAFMMTKRGIEREKGGLPFFRNDEACRMIAEKRPCTNLTKFCSDGLQSLQDGLDYRRDRAARDRLMELYKVI